MKLAGEWFHSRTVVECGSGVCSTHDLLNFIRSSLELLTALTPPPDSVDISVQLAAELGGREIVGGNGTMREKLRIVSIYFQALKKFLYATTRHCDETFFDNLTFPILRLLWKSTSKPSTDYVSTNDDYVIVIDDDDNDVDGKDTPLVNLSLSAVYRPAFKRVYFFPEFAFLFAVSLYFFDKMFSFPNWSAFFKNSPLWPLLSTLLSFNPKWLQCCRTRTVMLCLRLLLFASLRKYALSLSRPRFFAENY